MAGALEERTYHIGYANLGLEGLFAEADAEFIGTALQECWRPGAAVARFGRVWHLSRQLGDDGRARVGRIGFVNEEELATLVWDEGAQDFLHGSAPSGVVVPFLIDVATTTIAYQLRPGLVRPTTFAGALQSLLNSAGLYRWAVNPFVVIRDFESWSQSVDRITSFQFRLQRPNPHYHGDDFVEHLLEGLSLEVAQIIGRAGDDDSVDIHEDTFRQLLDHTRRNYGRGVVRGLDATGQESEWRTVGGGTVPAKVRLSAVGEEEAPEEVLARALSQRPGDLLAAAAEEMSDEPTG